MAQSGFTPIQIYYSTTPGSVPLAGDLANGELAINTSDGILYYKDSGGAVQILSSGSSISVSAVTVATTTNLASLSGLLTIDGVTVTAGQRVLVKDQTLSQNNGVYVAAVGAWTRSIDANSSTEIASRIISVVSGSTNGGEQFATTFKSTDTLGTTAMSWFQVALQNTAVTFTSLTTVGSMIFGNADTDTITQSASYVTGTQLKSAKVATNTLSLAAYDVDGAVYTNLITLTASNTPTLTLTSTGVGTINNMSIGATTASTGAFTTLSSTGNTTIGDASADTLTVNATSTFAAKPTVQLTSAATNTVTQVLRLDSQSSGTPANGIGVGLEFAAETSAGNTEVGATIEAVTTDVTATSEDFDLVVKLMAAGATAAETARFKSTGLSLVTGDTYQINNVDVLSATALGTSVVGSSLTSVGTIATGTWQGTVIGATYGGTGINNGARTLTINTNAGTIAFSGASTTMTFPSTSQTLAGLGLAQTFTAAQTFRAANAVRSEAAATQDAIVLAGRAGGTGSFAATITTDTLAASVTHTLPAITGTLATLANTGQTFTGQTSIIPATNSATITIGAIPQTGTITVDRSQATHTLDIGVGPTLSGNTKTINFGTAGVSGSTTNINIGSAVSGSTTTTAVNGNVSANYQADSDYFVDINNPFAGTYTTAKFVGIRAKGFYDNLGTAAPFTNYSGYLGWADTGTGFQSANFKIYTSDASGTQVNIFSVSPSNENTAVGLNALAANSGNANTAVGSSALTSNTIGANNTAIGASVLTSNTTGVFNTAVGYNALLFNVNGSSNTAFGNNSQGLNLSGNSNTSLGLSALYNNQTGSFNTAIGHTALVNNLGDLNIAIGQSSGSDITTGSNNVILGSYTGAAAPISATGSNWIVLSDGAGNVRQSFDPSGNSQMGSGAAVVYCPTPTTITAAATLTNADIQAQIVNTTGATGYTVTLPLGTTLETLIPWSSVDLGYDFYVINSVPANITMAANTGVTIVGRTLVATNISGQFRIRRTAANTFIVYRIN